MRNKLSEIGFRNFWVNTQDNTYGMEYSDIEATLNGEALRAVLRAYVNGLTYVNVKACNDTMGGEIILEVTWD